MGTLLSRSANQRPALCTGSVRDRPKRDDDALARHVGDKKAREIWFLNERYTAEQAREMGLVNKVVPMAQLDAAVKDWTDKLAQRSPTAIALAKRSFNADSDNIRGISNFALHAVKMFYDTAESKEGVAAFNEKRNPDFHKFAR